MTDLQTAPTAVAGPVLMRMPADPSMSRVLRLAASGLASLGGFSIDEIEDLKIAVSEVLIVLVEHGAGQPVELTFEMDDRGFRIEATTPVTDFRPDHPDLQLCRTVLESVCAFQDIRLVDGHARIRVVVARTPGTDGRSA